MTSRQDRQGRHYVYGPGLRLLTGVAWLDGVQWDELAFTRNVRRDIPRRGAWNLMAVHHPSPAADAAWEARERESVEVAGPEPTPAEQARARGIQRTATNELPE